MLKDIGILLQWFGVPCGCRCRHCSLQANQAISTTPYRTARAVAEKFLNWRKEREKYSYIIDFYVGYCIDFPHLLDYLRFRLQSGVMGADSVQINGIRLRSTPELRQLITSLKEIGVKRVGMTFYGMQKTHDLFCAREGDFEQLITIAEIVAKLGMQRFETIFLHKDSLADVQHLIHRLDQIPALLERSVGPWDFRGLAKGLEGSRPTHSDLEQLPVEIQQQFIREKYRTESDWIAEVRGDRLPGKTARYLFASIWPDTVGYLQENNCETVIKDIAQANGEYLDHLPPLATLADRYGDPKGMSIYSIRDLEWKWQDMFLRDRPDIGIKESLNELKSGAFLR